MDTAIKMLEKEQSDTSALQVRKQMLVERINQAAVQYDLQHSGQIMDRESLDWDDY